VSDLDKVTQQNASLVEESTAAAESLRALSVELVDAVAVFRLAAGNASPAPALVAASRPAPIAAPRTPVAAVALPRARRHPAAQPAGDEWREF
ncbi:MAG TPA: hypothetical protein VFV90_09340, partial [Usitatibacter sp.]|nr:hypothetical protein [Usitatibacter sp.]